MYPNGITRQGSSQWLSEGELVLQQLWHAEGFEGRTEITFFADGTMELYRHSSVEGAEPLREGRVIHANLLSFELALHQAMIGQAQALACTPGRFKLLPRAGDGVLLEWSVDESGEQELQVFQMQLDVEQLCQLTGWLARLGGDTHDRPIASRRRRSLG